MSFELPVSFSNNEPIIIRDPLLALKIPVFARCLNAEKLEDLEGVVSKEAVHVPFGEEAGRFIFDNVLKYDKPDSGSNFSKPEDYQEANEKSAEDLKEILELANYFECLDFVQVIGFVAAQKIKDWTVEDIAHFMGVEVLAEPDGWDEDNEWNETL